MASDFSLTAPVNSFAMDNALNGLGKKKAIIGKDIYTDVNQLQNIKHTDDKDAALKQVSKQFESMFINMMMKSMRQANAVFEEDSLFNSKETEFFRDMYDQQLALEMANTEGVSNALGEKGLGGIGIADAMYRQLSARLQPQTSEGIHGLTPEGFDAPARTSGEKPFYGSASKPWDGHHQSLGQASENSFSNQFLDAVQQAQPNANSTFSAARSVLQAGRTTLAESPEDYVRKVAPHAQRAAEKLGVDPAMLIAQSALETGWGQHVLGNGQGESSYNVFNIKGQKNHENSAMPSTTPTSVAQNTLEFKNGVMTTEKANFRVYENLAESFDDFANFLQENPRYGEALDNVDDAKAFIQGLHQAGYATDPHYSEKVLGVYKQIKGILQGASQ